MRPQFVLFGVAALAAALLALLVLRSGTSDGVDPGATAARASAIEDASLPEDPVELEPARTEVERSTASVEVASTPPATLAANEDGLAIVVGRVIDARGSPIADARVVLHSTGSPWAPGQDVPKRKVGNFEVDTYEATSHADGTFRIAVVVPTADWVMMSIEAGPFRGRASRDFGPAGGRNRPRIVAGENRLGDFALTDAGVVRGVVRGADGTVITKAVVRLDSSASSDRVINATFGENGAYELTNAPAGAWSVEAKSEGWLSASIPGVEVTALRTIEGVDFALVRAPMISGIVVDANGLPIEDVRVWGWPTSSGQGAGGKSGLDGRFTIYLPQNEPYDLEVTRQKHVENWGEGQTGVEVYAPGTNDVRIVVTRKQTLRFRVVDGASGAPITLYSLVLEDTLPEGMYRNRFDRIPAPVEHAAGEVELAISAGKQDVGVVAPGYAPCEAKVGADPNTPGVQTVSLEPESSLRLRVVHAGKPVDGATVLVECTGPIPGARSEAHALSFGDLAMRKRSLPTAAGGTLEVASLAAGLYRLTVDAPGLARLVRADVAVPAAGTVELGAIELSPSSRIRGRVITPPNTSPVGLVARVGRTGERTARISDPAGGFTIDGLEPGSHEIYLDRSPPLVMADKSRVVELGAGETVDVVFDLATMGPCRVELTVRSGGAPVAGLRVRWELEGGSHFGLNEHLTTDERGVALGTLPGGEEGSLRIERFGRMPYFSRKIPGGLPAGGSFVETIEIALGEVVVELPATLTRPKSGAVHLTLTNADPNSPYRFVIGTPEHAFPTYVGDGGPWTSSTVRITEVPVGVFDARVDAVRLERMGESDRSAWNSTEIYAVPSRSITVEAGKTTAIDLRSP